jgi:hypothetical protein
VIYSDSFKAKMVQRMCAPNAISAIRRFGTFGGPFSAHQYRDVGTEERVISDAMSVGSVEARAL